MSSFFSRKSGKSAARMPPPLTRAQSADPPATRAFAVDPPLHKTSSESHTGGRIASHAASHASSSSSSSSSTRGREKRKPIVLHYAQSPARNVANELAALALTASNTSASRRTATYSTDMDDDSMDEGAPSFDVDSAMAGFASSFSPASARGSKRRGTVTSRRTAALFAASAPPALPVSSATATTRPRSSTRARLSMNLTSSSQRHAQRAEVQAKKYDVAWRNDEDCACCQVCYAMFTKLSRRRHHCRVCGDLVCGDCSLDQVLLHGRFDAPKRACVACVTLLQVMRHSGDKRVTIESSSSSSSSKTPAAPVPARPTSHGMAPLATPRYHDRLGEVHRVMAAGKKSERRGSTQTEMYVIASAWLRTWLAFTRSANDYGSTLADSATDPFSSSGYSTATSTHSPHPSDAHASPPGPIDNMALLELSKGKLVKRPELVRDDGSRRYGEATESDGLDNDLENEGDYQLISTEVWEVLVRLYGGGPAIRVVSDDGFCDWIVDVSALLAAAASTVAIPSTVEHVLVTRHEAAVVTRASYLSVEKAALISSGGYDSTHVLAQSARASTRTGGQGALASSSTPSAKDSSAKASATGGPSDRGSFTARTSHSQARVRPNSPQYSASKASSGLQTSAHARASTKFAAASAGAGPVEPTGDTYSGDSADQDDLRSTTTGPKAATAASAFAVAMKQARLNAQKAIDDRSRGVRHADAA